MSGKARHRDRNRKKHTPEVVRKLATADRMLNDGKHVADVCWEVQVSAYHAYTPAALGTREGREPTTSSRRQSCLG